MESCWAQRVVVGGTTIELIREISEHRPVMRHCSHGYWRKKDVGFVDPASSLCLSLLWVVSRSSRKEARRREFSGVGQGDVICLLTVNGR